jgi:hypothetical protein
VGKPSGIKEGEFDMAKEKATPPRKRTTMKVRKRKLPKKVKPKEDEPNYKCMVCEYVPCICSSVSTWW